MNSNQCSFYEEKKKTEVEILISDKMGFICETV